MNSQTEWVAINRHLQRFGTATCDVSHLILNADDLRAAGNSCAAHMLASAARDVLAHRQRARQLAAAHANRKPKPVRRVTIKSRR